VFSPDGWPTIDLASAGLRQGKADEGDQPEGKADAPAKSDQGKSDDHPKARFGDDDQPQAPKKDDKK
jgi:hypothetical protein